MPIDSNDPLFNGLIYRSRINDIMNMSDSNAIGSFTIAELDTQYNDIVDLDAIESRTFDADSDGIVRGFTDFSNTINSMDENHWLQVDSDGYGNNMLGYQLDFASEEAGRRQPPIYSIGVSNLQSQRSTVSSLVQNVINASGALEAQVAVVNAVSVNKHPGTGVLLSTNSVAVGLSENTINASGSLLAQVSIVDGLAVDKHIASGTLEAQVSTVVGVSENMITGSGTLESQSSTASGLSDLENIASGTLEAQASTVDGAGSITPAIIGSGTLLAQVSTVVGTPTEIATASGILEAQVSTVVGAAENIITASGTLEAQVADVDGAGSITPAITGSGTLLAQVADADGAASVTPAITGSGTLEAQASTVDGAGDDIEPYVGMPFPQIYVGMPFPEIYVDGVVQGTSPAHTASGTLLSSSSEVDGLQPTMLGTFYYDNLLGNDTTGDGSAASPWASIDKALTVGLVPGYNVIGIDNGPTNPYRINTSSSSKIYVNNKFGTAVNPISLDGDPNSTDYLREYPDRPTTQYPNTYITNATTLSGWVLSSVYTNNVWEVSNPYPSSSHQKSAMFGCSSSEWTADGIMAVKREAQLFARSSTDPADLLPGEWYSDASKVYYRPKTAENMSTRHFEYCENFGIIAMKRVSYMSFNNIAFVCSAGTAVGTTGRGVNWEANGEGNGYVDDWCSYISINGCLLKHHKNATNFTIGEYYFINETSVTDNMNNGILFTGSKGDYPLSNRGFPVSNSLVSHCTVKRTNNNDGIVYHANDPYSDPNNGGNMRFDAVGPNHKIVNCTSSDNGENGFDITSGLNVTLLNCVSHDNKEVGVTIGHYARNVKVLNHISYNDDAARVQGGAMNIGDARNLLVDNLSAYNPGQRPITIVLDAGNVTIKNSKFISGPDTNRGNLIYVSTGGQIPQFDTQPRNGSTFDVQTPTSFAPDPYLNSSTPPESPQKILIKNNRFDVAYGGIVPSQPQNNDRFPYFINFQILPIKGYENTFEGNVFRTSVLNTQWQPNTASDLPASDHGPYLAKNTSEAVSAGGQPVINSGGVNQTFFAAGNFTNESDLWNFWPTGVTPIGRETYTDITGEPTGVYNTAIGFTTNDTQTDMPLWSSAHNISGQSTYWAPATVEGIWNDPALEYWEQTNWSIAAPSTTDTYSRAVGYIDSGVSNISVQAPWSGDHRVSGGPLVCMNSAVSEFGLSFVWYAGAAGNASYLALFEVGQQPTDRTLKGISAPFPHTDGVEVRLVMEVKDGILRCYAGIRPDQTALLTPDNQYSSTLIPLTTTEGGATFSETYDIATNNSNLNGSTTHGTYLYNNQTPATRTANLRYSVFPAVLRELT